MDKKSYIGKKREEGIGEVVEEITPEELKKLGRITRSSYKILTNKDSPY